MGQVASAVMGSSDETDYEHIEQATFDNIQLGSRNYDCVMVFDIGENVDWKPPADGAAIQYEYLGLLDTKDIEERKRKFPQHGADFARSRPSQMDFYKFERKLVIKALMKLNIKVARIQEMGKEFEKDEGKIFYYVGIRESTARRFAHRIHYNLELEAQAAIVYFNLQDEPLARATLSEDDNAREVLEDFWHNIYVRFDLDVAPEIYKSYDVLDEADQEIGYEDSLFTIRDRCALINEIVTQDIEVGGAGIYVPALATKDHCVVDFFPLHTKEQLDDIVKDLFDIEHLTYNCLTLPLDKFRIYFGEYIAIYFAYLQYFTWFLFPASIVGLIFGTWQYVEGRILLDWVSWFALVVIVWSMMFPLLWRNLEYWYAMKWGTLKFDENERPRPEFEGIYMRSTIDGKLFEYFPNHLRAQRRLLSLGVVAAFLVALGASVFGVVVLRIWVTNSDVDLGDYYVSGANALTIMFFNNIYGIFAEQMNQWENYKTESEYEDQLIIKIFVFRFINSYATLYYYAFVRPFEDEDSTLYCKPEKCMRTLRTQLAVIFLSQLLVSNAIELGELFVKNLFRGGIPTFGSKDTKKRIWTEYTSEVYERTFDDYCELLISYGYCSLFVIAFPYALAAGFIGGIIEARIDGYKLCRLTRRPFPRQADDIGSWQFSMEFMAYAVLFTNLGIVCFVTDDLDFGFLDLDNDTFEEVITAMIVFFILSFIIRIANFFVSKKPAKIDMHEKRQQHVEKQLVIIGERIERYLDGLGSQEISNWQNWSTTQVLSYLREVLFKNNDEFQRYYNILSHKRFDGKKFAIAEDHDFQDMGINDYFVIRFLTNARRILDDHLRSIRTQNALLDDIDRVQSGRRGLGPRMTDADQPTFRFTLDHLLPMADFFEEDFAGQSKKKLWERVDKDESSVIEKAELSTFVYYTIVVYIKSKFEDAKIPKADDPRFKRDIIDPLKSWLLHYKMTTGLTFDDFDRYFPTWIREYYRERKSGQMGIASGFDDDLKEDAILSAYDPNTDTISRQPLTSTTVNNAANDVLGAPTGDFTGMASMDSKSLGNDWRPTNNIDRSKWTPESREWETKLEDFANSVDKTSKDTRKKLWEKFDKYKKGKLDSDKYFRYLLYSLIALHVKTKDRTGKPPTQPQLEPFLIWLANEIRPMLKDNNGDRRYIQKKDFVSNIGNYLKQVAGIGKKKKGLFGR